MMSEVPALTLHSSWRTLIGGVIGSGVLVVFAVVGMTRGGVVVPLVIGVFGAFLVVVLLTDMPVSTRFDRDGIERRAALRRHRLAWEQVDKLGRARGRLLSTHHFSPDPTAGVNRGGLVAVVGGRRYLLVDTAESRGEFEQLDKLLRQVAPGLSDELLLPPEGAPPTYLYRRRSWRPDSSPRR